MDNKEPITAEEFEELPTTQEYINQRFREEFKRDYYEVVHHEHNFNHDFIEEFTYKVMHEYAVLFAKHHVREALKEASKKSTGLYANSISKHYLTTIDATKALEDSIENAYPESEIQ